MISVTIIDPKEAHLLMRQIQFSWTAHAGGEGTICPDVERWTEWDAKTGEIQQWESERYREFNWFPKGRDLPTKLLGKSFANVPQLTLFLSTYSLQGKKLVVPNFHYWLALLKGDDLAELNFSFTTTLFFSENERDGKSQRCWSILFRASGQESGGTTPLPVHLAITAPSNAPRAVLDSIKLIGFDQGLESELRTLSDIAMNYLNPMRPENALARLNEDSALGTVVDLFISQVENAFDVRLSTRAVMYFPGDLVHRSFISCAMVRPML